MNLDVFKNLKTNRFVSILWAKAATGHLEERRSVTMELKMRPLPVNKGKTKYKYEIIKKSLVNAVYE